jgi:hypothetical protein
MATVARRAHAAKDGSSQLRRAPLRALALAGVVGLSLLATACGHSSGAKVAQTGTTSSTNGSTSPSASGSGDPTAYSACMRRHGLRNFPDPDSEGHLQIPASWGIDPKTGVATSPRAKAAAQACRKLRHTLAGRPTAAQEAAAQQAMLRFAQCMRSHGVPKFPDPQPGGALELAEKVAHLNTPQFKAAQQTCRRLVPGAPISAAARGANPTP